MFFRRSFSLLLISLCSIPGLLLAQSRINSSGNGGLHTIQGRIYSPTGKMIDNTITVRLESMSFGELSLVTDQDGGFVFKALSPGTYTVVVDAGSNFEIVRESVTIDPQIQSSSPGAPVIPDRPRVFNVPVSLRLKRNAEQKTGVVNAKLSEVPEDALKHYEKGIALSQEGKGDEAIGELRQAI